MDVIEVATKGRVPASEAWAFARLDGGLYAFSYQDDDGNYLGRGHPSASLAREAAIEYAEGERVRTLYWVKAVG